jgi:tripartite-type tricarboxylate transporter receptor subunit TctC
LTCGSSGTGSFAHLGLELFNSMAGIRIVHVPYKGSGQALQDLLAGQVPYMVDQIASSAGHARQGRLRVMAVMTGARSSILPEVQTLAELGIAGVEAASFTGILAPAGLPQPVLERLLRATLAAAAKPHVVQRFREIGADPRALGGAEFSQFLKSDLERWKGVAAKANIALD